MRSLMLLWLLLLLYASCGSRAKFVSPTRHSGSSSSGSGIGVSDISSTIIIVEDAKGRLRTTTTTRSMAKIRKTAKHI